MAVKMLSVKEAAELVGVKPATIRTWIKEGKLKAIKIGRIIRIHDQDLQDFLK